MNGEVNCILSVCCPDPAEQEAALAKLMTKEWGCSKAEAAEYSAKLLAAFDLAPKGFFTPLVHEIVRIYNVPRHD